MSMVVDALNATPPAAQAISAFLIVAGGFWKGWSWAVRRERTRQSEGGGKRFDDAEGANARLFKFLGEQIDELRQEVADARADCRACEQREVTSRQMFSAEIQLMNAQYRERHTAQSAEIAVLRDALRKAGHSVPDGPIVADSTISRAFDDGETPAG